jgi:D-alanyl-lipoteichoic acid acyltransferase DltB (MBOAT superfamily)
MTFASLTFLLFFPVVFALHWAARRRTWQNLILIITSYVFYGWWDYRFCALMLISSLIDYGIGWALGRTQRASSRRGWLWLSIVCNLGLLGFFKYFNFFAENLQQMADMVGWQLNTGTLEIILPVGISFYTFQTLSYTIDVYRQRMSPTRNLIDYLAFVSFFPQLVAGPIERATHLLPQFARSRQFDEEVARDAFCQILWGFVKKLVLADRLAAYVDSVYAAPDAAQGPALALATVCFAFQIYCDFSAYSDIAIGTAKLFGVDLIRNFAYPYFSQTMSEFWRRWHISLSTWFRDYVYLPLGGSHTTRTRSAINVLITFVVSGLWHGAAWRFLLWGGLNGGAVVAEKRLGTDASPADTPGGEHLIPRPRTLIRMLWTFTLACVCWVFFRASTIYDGCVVLRNILRDLFTPSAYELLVRQVRADPFLSTTLVVLAAFIVVEWIQRREEHPLRIRSWSLPVRWATYTILIWGSLNLMPTSRVNPFIYFTF